MTAKQCGIQLKQACESNTDNEAKRAWLKLVEQLLVEYIEAHPQEVIDALKRRLVPDLVYGGVPKDEVVRMWEEHWRRRAERAMARCRGDDDAEEEG